MRSILSAALLLLFLHTNAQLPAIVPRPVDIQLNTPAGEFILNDLTQILISDSSMNPSASFLSKYLLKHYQITLAISTDEAHQRKKNTIRLIRSGNNEFHTEGYHLSTAKDQIQIIAPTNEGIFYGLQSLIQLLPLSAASERKLIIPAVRITDHPRFAYRGMHLDVSRHFFDINFIKKYIDYLAMYKLNYFHWHLTDDHGWRIEIKKYPKLTEIGAWRNGTIIGLYPGIGNDGLRYGGYYTQEEVKEVIKYAADRYITIIPEIEMPGHSMSVLSAYPEFGTTPNKKFEVAQTWGIFNKFNNVLQPTEKTFIFLEEVLSEVMNLFPSPYIHIGGDECSKIWWKQSAISQQIIRQKGLKDENGLQSYMIHRIEKFVNSKGKIIIGWDEILDGGLAPNAVVMSWRGEKGGIAAAKQKHKVIMTPENFMYFNHAQFLKEDSVTATRYVPLKTVYDYDPVPKILTEQEGKYIWGAQGNLWSEYIANPDKAEYMLFPRLAALSEILWTQKNRKNYFDFQKRLKNHFQWYDLMKINYSKRYLSN